jgi:folate-binding protein YgfZ
VRREDVRDAERQALTRGAVVARRAHAAVLRLTGGGRVTCLQGLVTCDVAKPGDHAHLFGALLTPKGMIVAPLWISRLPDALWLETPAASFPPLHEVLTRSLPPRLCRAENVTPVTAAIGVYGPRSGELVARVLGAHLVASTVAVPYANGTVVVAHSVARGPAGYDILLPVAMARALEDDLLGRGAAPASPALLEEARILGGVPRLGAEIDERTLPQEVRYEELGALSYTKGCYLGQETVARLHFRGRAQRRLAALALETAPAAVPQELRLGDAGVGRLTSAAWDDDAQGYRALGLIRRDVADGAVLDVVGGGRATVLPGPWAAA